MSLTSNLSIAKSVTLHRYNENGSVTYNNEGGLSVVLIIPGDPQTGANLQFNRHTGAAYRPQKHKDAVYGVSQHCSKLLSDCNLEAPLFGPQVPLSLSVELYFPYRKGDYGTGKNAGKLKPNAPEWYLGKKDIDNLLKPLKDGFRGSLMPDDKQIVRYGEMVKKYHTSPHIILRVHNLVPVDMEGNLDG